MTFTFNIFLDLLPTPPFKLQTTVYANYFYDTSVIFSNSIIAYREPFTICIGHDKWTDVIGILDWNQTYCHFFLKYIFPYITQTLAHHLQILRQLKFWLYPSKSIKSRSMTQTASDIGGSYQDEQGSLGRTGRGITLLGAIIFSTILYLGLPFFFFPSPFWFFFGLTTSAYIFALSSTGFLSFFGTFCTWAYTAPDGPGAGSPNKPSADWYNMLSLRPSVKLIKFICES